jgi:hypothetical protein
MRLLADKGAGVEYYLNVRSGRRMWGRPAYLGSAVQVPVFDVPRPQEELHALCASCPAAATVYCRACMLALCSKCSRWVPRAFATLAALVNWRGGVWVTRKGVRAVAVCARAGLCVYVRACVRVRVRVCVCACVCGGGMVVGLRG